MSFYRDKLLDTVRALADHDDLNARLTHGAGCLLEVNEVDVPFGMLSEFDRIRDSLIGKPMVAKGEILPRDFGLQDGEAAAVAIVDLLVAEMGKP